MLDGQDLPRADWSADLSVDLVGESSGAAPSAVHLLSDDDGTSFLASDLDGSQLTRG